MIQDKIQSKPAGFLTESEEGDSSRFRLLTENSILKRPGAKESKNRSMTQQSEDVRTRKRMQMAQPDVNICLSEI